VISERSFFRYLEEAVMENLITIEELSKRLHKSVKSILNDRCRNPASIPPAVKFPGSRKVLFLESDVQAHIMKFRETPIEANPSKLPTYNPRKKVKDKPRSRVGRPTNSKREIKKIH
jgi:hypothetical protein